MNIRSILQSTVRDVSRIFGFVRKCRCVEQAQAMLQELEPRVLLSTFTWSGGANDGNWNSPGNWKIGNDIATVAPNANDAYVKFIDVGPLTVNMDISPAVSDLWVAGDSQVKLVFNDDNHDMTVHYDGAYHTDGEIYLSQTAGKNTSLTFDTNSLTQITTVEAHDVLSTDDDAGSSALTVSANTELTLNGNLDASHDKFDLNVYGATYANNVYLTGKDASVTSDVDISGLLQAEGAFVLGGDGFEDMSINGSGGVRAKTTRLNNGTSTVVTAVTGGFWKESRLGDAYIGEASGGAMDTQAGATVTVNGGQLIAWDMHVGWGQSVKVIAQNGGHITINRNLLIGGGQSDGPVVMATGTGSNLEVDGRLAVINNDDLEHGTLIVTDAASVSTDRLYVWTDSSWGAPENEVVVTDFGQIMVNRMVIGGGFGVPVTGGAGGVFIDGAGTIAGIYRPSLKIGTKLEIGNGSSRATLDTGTDGIASTDLGASIVKSGRADIQGSGIVSGFLTPPPPPGWSPTTSWHADVLPGDFFVGHDSEGNLLVNDDSENPYGTLTIDGDLVDGGTLKLDSHLGLDPTNGWSNSTLGVTGDVTLDNAALYVSGSGSSAMTIPVGSVFTLLTGNTITGQFAGLGNGQIFTWDSDAVNATVLTDSSVLPKLSAGLGWLVNYVPGGEGVQGSVTLTVVGRMINAAIVFNSSYYGSPQTETIAGVYAPKAPLFGLPAELLISQSEVQSDPIDLIWNGMSGGDAETGSEVWTMVPTAAWPTGGELEVNGSTNTATLYVGQGYAAVTLTQSFTFDRDASGLNAIFTPQGDAAWGASRLRGMEADADGRWRIGTDERRWRRAA